MYCLFCRFVNRELPCRIVYETDQVLAYQDWNQWAELHIIVFPKAHIGLKDKDMDAYQQAVSAVEAAVLEIERICGMAKVFQVIRCEREPHITQNLDYFHYHILGSTDPEAQPPTDL
ncbi:HIT family protein [Acidaminococcus sp. LBK-2]